MQIPEFSIEGFLTVYVVQGIVFVIFILIGYSILKRSRKNPNFILSLFFLSTATGLFINFIFVLLLNELIVLILYYMTLFFIFLSPIFFLIFNLLIIKSEHIMTKKNQCFYIITYGIIVFSMIFIPKGIIINEGTDWQPIWNIWLFIYLINIVSIFAIGPGLYYSGLIYKKFKDSELKKRWNFYLIGVGCVYFLMYAIMTANYLNNDIFRIIIGFFGIVFSIIGGLLIYYGIGRILK